MTNREILKIAMAQSAMDLCAMPDDFEKSENVVVTSRESEGARRYLKLPFSCQLVSYGSGVVASVSPEFREIAENYINQYPVEHLFETPHLHALNEKLMEKGQKICFMAEYFLPDMGALRERVERYAPSCSLIVLIINMFNCLISYLSSCLLRRAEQRLVALH